MHIDSSVFATETLDMPGEPETVVRGGRHLFGLLPETLHGVQRIGVLGWGPQGRAQARNLRDSLAGTGIVVTVGLRPGSASAADARAHGFTEDDGTLGDWIAVAGTSDMVILLIADAALAAHHEELFAALKPGATIGLSHGFLLGHLRATGGGFPPGHPVIAVCPKGMGDSVRRLYEQGASVDGAGINASIAVHADPDGHATDRALAWSVALGAPYTFATTLESEYLSDVVGERAILLGAVHGLVEALFRHFRIGGDEPVAAYRRSCEAVTGPIATTISRGGLGAVREAVADTALFDRALAAAYAPSRELVAEIYDEVAEGAELRSVLLAEQRLRRHPMAPIGGSPMWDHGSAVRASRGDAGGAVEPLTAGLFVGTMLAQVDELAARGHAWSEIVNESIIEAVDSLLPYMHARDVAYMVDNCSMTARLGARRWGPRFQAAYEQLALPAAQDHRTGPGPVEGFADHPVHAALAAAAALRPSVDIAVDAVGTAGR
ncbi:Ketol-acid reductoisomerase [Pseudonocardia sp. Ae168_Ps1]|uniref:ketol-acid reductoisomerase n=1 Tax=unclassified Pseudonocardia TaxID=2619320 RepID=UPI00094B224E|nr:MULTISPECIES: ketol-acid reductoisomerase [unclassified Pseudonocardia]OLL75845.1 Ketol-acid reductoisomerase [Pseudonocardia sp. Ae150A_Ps1]OLL81843.1 Ketol-acid reductoisomerase [Pseudonocardia sp. Ae168_Ps1]OLL84045.1 Ketol-acid reductoisomerase [Pseudonocardia sp. Ae263_Ps1]OLL95936.1 Ketol-acid reductoisomerase [Pseudonocardia sp. Ae356_Ps1]